MDLMPGPGKATGGVDIIEHNELKEKNRKIQTKLLDSMSEADTLKKENVKLRQENEVYEKDMKDVKKERDLHKQSQDQQKQVIEELVEQLEIKSKEKSGYEAENQSLVEGIKELRNDNAMLLKKVSQIQQQQVDKMDEINKLYDQLNKQKVDEEIKQDPDL